MLSAEEWCEYLYVGRELSRGRNIEFMRFVLDEARDGRLERIDAIFQMVDADKLESNVICGMLRSSSMFRNRLLYWQPFRDRSVEALKAKGIEPMRLLCGLFDELKPNSSFPGLQDLLGVHPELRD